MRNWDNWLRYQDNDRNPLHGCIQFNVKDGNTVAPIYDSEGTAIANPQITDYYGRTQQQVFIDTDVTAYFYKFIGEGSWAGETDIDTSDVSKWELQYTSDNYLNMGITLVGDNMVGVSTVSGLRELNPEGVPEIDGKKSVMLLGYYELGDKEPVMYVWNEPSYQTDNGGSVIQSSEVQAGQWVMVQPTEHCDSRHFGVFPQDSSNCDDQTYGITKLFEYCNICGIRPYFNGSVDYRWFKYGNISVTADQIDVTDATRFYDTSTSTITGEWNGNPYFQNANTNLVCKNVKTSWHARSYTGYRNVIIDSDTEQRSWQNARVEVLSTEPVYGFGFNNCEIVANGNLGSNAGSGYNIFNDCVLEGDMFIVSGANETSFSGGQATNCVARLEDWKKDNDQFYFYVQLRVTNDSSGSFDYNGMTSNVNPMPNYESNIVNATTLRLNNYNYTGGSAQLARYSNATTLFINNCSGIYNFNLWSGQTVVIKNCKDFVISQVPSNLSLMIEDSSVSILSSERLANLSINNSTLTGASGVTVRCSGFTSYASIMSCNINCDIAVIKDSQINSGITITYDDSTTCSAFIDNNIVNARITLQGKENTTSTYHHVVNTIITNNYSAVTRPINVVYTYLDPVDASHSYKYEGNSGTFVPGDNSTFNQTMTFTTTGNNAPNPVDFPDNSFVYDCTNGYVEIKLDNTYFDSHTTINRGISGPFNIFRIGRDSFRVTVSWCINGTSIQTGLPWFEFALPDTFPMIAKCMYSNEQYRLNTLNNTGGTGTLRFAINRCGRTLQGGYPDDYATIQISCTFTVHKNP